MCWIEAKNSDYKKIKYVNRNVFEKITHNECKDVLLNQICLRLLMNRIQSKNHRIRTYEINRFFLSYFDNKTYIQNNGYDELALGYRS